MKVAVIGGGIAGTSVAFELRRNGVTDVTLFEKNNYLGTECSFANGGQISVCNAETWLTWKNIYKAMKWCFKKDAPLYFNPMPTPDKLLWLSGFMKNVTLGVHERNTIETIRLGLLSRSLYESILDESSRKKVGQTACGMLHVYNNHKSFDSARQVQNLFESNGVEWIEVTPKEIISKDSNMSSFQNLVGGFLTPSDTVADINSLTNLLGQKSKSKIKNNAEVVGVFKFGDKVLIKWETDGEQFEEFFDQVIFSNGHSVRKFSYLFGDFFNIYPVKGYSVTYLNPENPPMFSLLDDDKKIVSSTFVYGKNEKRFRIAGTAELAGTNSDIRKVRTRPLHQWVADNFDVTNSDYSEWACHRPMTSDMMPIYRESTFSDRIWYHGGHGHLGLTLAMGTSNILVKDMLRKYNK